MTVIRAFGATHKGAVRARNEDHVLLGETTLEAGSSLLEVENDDRRLESGLLLAVADGIGGEAGGSIASRETLQLFRNQFLDAARRGLGVHGAIEEAGERANRALMDTARRDPDLSGMGCTLCGLYLNPPEVQVFNCGDSRAYRLRNSFLKRLTDDHTVASAAMRQGRLSAAEADASPTSHHLTNHLGLASYRMAVEKGPNFRPGDVLLLCTDGLYDLVDEETIIHLIADSDASLEEIGEALVNRAIANGGYDNISVILVCVMD